jgi:hypothetical protein
MPVIIDGVILLSLCCFGIMIWFAKSPGADRS